MYVGRDFDPSDTGENERYTLDFINDMQAGDGIHSAVWTCGVAAKSQNPDDAAGGCISEPAVYLGSKTTQRVNGMKPGVIYVLKATVTTTLGDVVSLWSHVECKAPA
jgi:hypothetical protein